MSNTLISANLQLLCPDKYGKAIIFRNLRKTFITSAYNEFGLASTALTNHKNPSMTDKHYYDEEVTRDEARQSFSVFKKKAKK